MNAKKLICFALLLMLLVCGFTLAIFADDAVAQETGAVEVGTYDELVAELAKGGQIKLTADITVDTKLTAIDDTVLDLNTKTLYVNVENSTYGNVTIKNGNIVLGKDDVHVCDGYFLVNAGKTLVLDGVKVSSSAEGIKGYAVFHLKTGANLDLLKSELNIVDNEYSAGYIVYANESTASVDVVDTTVTGSKVNGIVHATTVIEKSTFTITDAVEHGINRSGVTIDNSTVAISGGTGRGITAQHGPLVIKGNSTVTVSDMGEATIELRNDQDLTVEDTATVKVDVAVNNTTSGTVTGNVTIDTTLSALVVIGENGYKTLADALNAAKAMTGDVTVYILEKVTLNTSITGNFDSITFKGTTNEAEIYLDVQGYVTATGKKVSFDSLKLSKSAGGFINNAGFMNVAFGIYDVQEVNYTDCVFLNGAYASSGKVTFTGCTFNKSHEKYGLWAYGDVDATVDNCTFDLDRGIKMYAEGAAKTTDLTVTNTNFSNLTGKPAIVLTYGESVTLAGNTYSGTGVFELDLDGAPNGTPITSTDTITCVNDNGACGVLVDGKIYTTVAQAAAVATAGDDVILLHNSAETVVFPLGVNLDKNGFEATGVTVTPAVAKIGETSYSTLQAAIDAAYTAGGNVTITLLDDVTETLTINEKVGLYLTIDGAEKKLNGKITINPLSDTNDNRRITIENVKFVDTSDVNVDFITAVETNHYPRLTVQGCTFTGSGNEGDVAIRTKSAYGLVIKDCTGTGLHSFLQNTSGVGITVENVTVSNSKGGLAMGTAQNVTVSDCDVDTLTYGIRLDAQLNTKVTLDNNVVNSYIPVSVRKATANDYNLTFAGDDSEYTASNTDGVWCAICATEYEVDKELNEATGIVKVEVKTDAIDKANLWGAAYPVAKIGDVVYYTLADAIAAGGEIVLLTDVTEDVTIADGATVILDLGGKTLTGAIKPCKPASLTVKNGTIDNDNASYSAIEVNAGTFVLENVNITSVRHGVRIDGPVTATINGGSYKVDATSGTRHAVNVSGAADVTIVAGTFVGPKGTTMDSGAAVNVQSGATVVINGGNFSGGKNKTLSVGGTLTVYGGTFDQNPIAFVADGYCVVAENGSYTVALAYAKIGNNGYPTLEAALKAAQDGNTIVLVRDITLNGTVTVPAGKTITLDLAGYTVSGVCNTSQGHMFMVANTATLIIKDSSNPSTGKITYAGNNSTGWIIDVEGAVVLESGTLELTGTWNIGYAVDVRPNAWGTAYTAPTTFTMNGGKILTSDGGVRVASSSYDSYSNISASFVMNGGLIDAAWDGIFVQQSNGAWDVLSVTINGGTVLSDLNPIRFYGPAATSYVNGNDCVDIALNGGTLTYTGTEQRVWLVEGIIRLGGGVTATEFLEDSSIEASEAFADANTPSTDYKWVENANGDFELVAKVYVAEVGGAKYETIQEAVNAAQTGDVVTILAGDYTLTLNVNKAITVIGETDGNGNNLVNIAGKLNITANGAVVKNLNVNNGSSSAGYIGAKDVLVEGCTVVGGNGFRSCYTSGLVTFRNCTITGATYGIHFDGNAGGEIVIENCTITGWTSFAKTINKVTMTGTKFEEGNYNYVRFYQENVTIEDCTFNENMAVDIAVPNTNLVINNSTLENGSIADLFEEEDMANSNITVDNVALARVAKIGDVYYETIQEAVDAAQAGDTITLLRDVTLSDIFVINKAITLDGNGKTLTSTAGRAINVSGADGVTIKNLTINCSGERAINVIQNATNVTIDNVTATAANYTVNVAASAPNAVVVIKNSTLNGLCTVNVASAGADVTVTDSTINCNDNNTTVGESYAALSLNKDAINGKIIATGCTINVTDGSDSVKARNGAENGVITIDGTTDGVNVVVAIITYAGSNYYHAFYTLDSAIEFAKAGDTITLIRDVTLSDILVIDKAITIDGNGKTITSTAGRAINIDTTAAVTIKNLTIVGSTGCERGINIINQAGTTNLSNVKISGVSHYAVHVATSAGAAQVNIEDSELSGYAALAVYGAGSVVEVSDSALSSVNEYEDNGSNSFATIVIAANNAKISVEGGSVSAKAEADKAQQAVVGMNAGRTNMTLYLDTELVQNGTATLLDIDPAAVNITLRAEYADKANAEGYAVIAVNGMLTVKAAVARIGNVNYATIQEAVDAAQAGEVITILKNVTLEKTVHITAGKKVTIDLNGKTIDFNPAVWVYGAANSGTALLTVDFGGDLTIDDTSAEKTGTIDGSANVNDVYGAVMMTAKGDNPENGTAKLTVNGGTLIGGYAAIAGNKDRDNTEIVINGGIVKAYNSTIYATVGIEHPMNGKLTINGGTIMGMDGISFRSGTLIINGGTIIGTAPSTTFDDDGYWDNDFGACTGLALQIVNRANSNSANETPSVTINGGEFISENAGSAIGSYAGYKGATPDTQIVGFISGGSFNKPVAENLCADGFIPVPDANGNYVVRAGKFVVRNSTTGVGYETLQAAINAATAGDVITIIDNLNESVTVQMSLTIDGGNKTYTGTITITGNVNVTVQNVKFVNGAISHSSGTSSGRLTVKDSTFQNGGYAITTASIRSVTIENCNVFNQSLLYAKRSTSEIIVKDVTVVGGNYGAHIVYNNTATFENVIMVDMIYGIMVQNHGAKVITLTNCDIRGNNPIYTWEKASATDTFKLVGANKLVPTDPATFTLSQYMKLVLADETATLEAPANLGVTEGIEHPCYKVVYENGIYKVVLEHTVVVDAAVAPDCTNTGLTEGSHCSVCDEVLVAQQVVDALGHTWEEATVYAPKTCTVCGVTEGDPLKAVASIGANKYPSIKEAVDAANNGDVIVILESGEIDIASGTLNEDGYYALIVAGNGKEFTIDLNVKQLTVDVTNLPAGLKSNMLLGVFCADTNGKLTLTDSVGGGSVSVTGGAANTVYSMAIAYEGLINIEGGSYSVDYMNEGRGMIYGNVSDHSNPDGSNAYAGVNISDGNFHLGNVGALTNGSPWILATSGSNSGKYVFVSGGTYNSDVLNQHWVFEVFAPTTKALKNNGNGTYTVTDAVVYLVHHEYSEYHSETGFATIEEALERAVAGDTIVLNKDITLDAGLTIPANLELTLDLAGYTLSLSEATTTTSALITNNGTLTITDTSDAKTGMLTYSNSNPSTGYSTSTIINNGVLTVEGGTIENNTTSGAPYAVDNYNTLTVNGGTFVAVRNVIRQAQFGNYDNIVTINGGTFTGYAGLQLHVFNNTKKTETVINGGTFTGTYATYTSFYTANASANTSITVNDGTFNGDYAVFFYNSKAGAADYAFDAAIKGGTFNAPVYVYVNDAEGNYIDLPVISGGTFTDPVLAENCVAGFGLHANADGTYGVHEHIAGEAQKENETLPSYEAVGGYDMVVHCTVCDEILSSTHVTVDKLVAAATVDGVSYETLADALAAASGKTIVLQTDVTYAGYMILDGATLDLNGNTLTVDGALIALKGSSIVDNTDNGVAQGKIVVDGRNALVLSDVNYPMLPVWMPDTTDENSAGHYVFVNVDHKSRGNAVDEDSFNVLFEPVIGSGTYDDALMGQIEKDHGLSIEVFVHCMKAGVEVEELHFVLTKDLIADVYANDKVFSLNINGATAEFADEYVVTVVVKSERGVSCEKQVYTFVPTAPSVTE